MHHQKPQSSSIRFRNFPYLLARATSGRQPGFCTSRFCILPWLPMVTGSTLNSGNSAAFKAWCFEGTLWGSLCVLKKHQRGPTFWVPSYRQPVLKTNIAPETGWVPKIEESAGHRFVCAMGFGSGWVSLTGSLFIPAFPLGDLGCIEIDETTSKFLSTEIHKDAWLTTPNR